MLREALGRRAGATGARTGTGTATATATGTATGIGTGARAGRPGRRLRAWLPGLVRRHRLFSVVLGLSVVPRVIVMLGFQPAVLFKLDSYDYLWDAAHLRPNPVNPGGYTVFLWLLAPLRSLTLIAALQHLAGLAVAIMVYAVLRRFGVRPWIATLACVPVLFDPAQFLLEQLIMADMLALLLMVAAFAVLLLRDRPSVPRSAVAGLLMGASAVVRPTALPLIAALAVYLLAKRAGWRRVCALLAAGALPVVAYMSWFAAVYGSFNLTNSNGLFLWSRTMSFADCATIKPPADLLALCPNRQPGAPAAGRLLPKQYLWNHSAWQWKSPAVPAGIVPDTAAFTPANNARALRFAVKAIEAQPIGYAGAVARDVAIPFLSADMFAFPGTQPALSSLGASNRRYALAAVQAYAGSTAGIGPYLGHHLGTRLQEPYAHLIRGYQRVIFLPGPVFALIVAIGLAGILIPRRRSGAAVLLWACTVVTVVLPIAEHEYTYRYVIPAVPLACMAAALAWAYHPAAGPAGDGAGAASPEPGTAASAPGAAGGAAD
jgi:hypothetical protein